MRLTAALLTWAMASLAVAEQPPLHQVLEEAVQARLTSMDIPGAAVAVVRANAPVLLAGFGTVDPDDGVAVDPERHAFRVGSVSKPLTATLVLRLFESRGLGLHGDLRAQLERLPIRPPLERPMTMHHLLTHTAGFNEQLFGQHVREPSALLTLGDYLERHLPPRFIEPGRVIAYNDHHTVLAGWVAERVGGAAFPELVEQWVLRPLGMSSTSFRQIQPAGAGVVRTRAWHRRGEVLVAYPSDYVHTTPAAGAWSTAADMARYLEALLRCADGPIEAPVCERQLRRQAAHHELLPGRAYGFAEGRHGDYRLLFKDGQASGFNARLLLVPEIGLGIFVVHNRNILGRFGGFLPASRFNREVTAAVLQALHPAPEPSSSHGPLAPVGDASNHTRYSGTYRNVVAARHSWERFAGLFDDVRVSATARGVDFHSGEYVEVAPGVVAQPGREHDYRVFAVNDQQATHLFIGGGAYERIPWYATSRFASGFALASGVWFLGATVLGARIAAGRRRWLLWLPPLCLLGFMVGFLALMAMTDVQTLFHGPPPALLGLLALPLLAAGVLAYQAVALVTRPRVSGWCTALELSSMGVCAAFLLWLHYWNLLGYRLG